MIKIKHLIIALIAGLINAQSTPALLEHNHNTMPIASIWEKQAAGKRPNRNAKIESFINDCDRYSQLNNKVPIHTAKDGMLRIATYNVHAWRDAHKKNSFDAIFDVIATINADVLILQEVRIHTGTKLKKAFKKLGYTSSLFANTTKGSLFGNMMFTKCPMAKKSCHKTFKADKGKIEQRNFIQATLQIAPKKQITLFGTHLEVHDRTDNMRAQEVQELIDTAAKIKEPCIIMGDCNAIRAADYQYTVNDTLVWDLLNKEYKERTGLPAPTKALGLLETDGFKDCFTKSNNPCPKFTVWSGTAVDFMWLSKSWNLPIKGSYVYYNSASDHLPVIMDVDIQ